MTITKRPGIFQPHHLALAVTLGVTASTAHAFTFNFGEIKGQFDSSLSVGASWSMQSADRELIGPNNGGKGESHTGDDGRLNFKKGETFSKIFKGIHDLELKYRDTGVFLRGKYWYDFEVKDDSRLFKDIDDHNRKEAAQSSGAELLDAFVYHNYSIGNLPGSVRLGKQVVSWGESTFILNAINAINPLDVAAFRRPGAEIKEGLIPVNMFYVSQSLTDQLSAEAFYQLEWDQTVVDNCGTFFSTSDLAADGCDDNFRVLSPALAGLQPIAAAFGQGFEVNSEGVLIPRAGDRDARDSGQYGIALRWLGDAAEYGAYFINYHSRLPYFGTRTAPAATFAALPGMLAATPAPFRTALAAATLLANGSYYMEYPEDVRLYGLSFATTLPTGTAWSGEISYRPNAPVDLNGNDVTNAMLNPALGAFSPIQSSIGADNTGYRRKEVTQAQTTLIHFIDQFMGASRLILVGEVGWHHIGGLPKATADNLRFGRASVFGSFGANGDVHGFHTSDSWGYRARAIWEYNDVFAGINLKPNLAWSHDVDGYSPVFNEGAKAVSVGVEADYRSTYTASLSYTDLFGGKYNTQVDRDFLALSLGMTF
ncbi:MAG: DUF1302 domain-containing protein [Achromobacter sp.]|nr:DUF1302 domain-containing protein [Achromobacter sp.]